jgi:DNA-binding transcriptional ArsR family regulator
MDAAVRAIAQPRRREILTLIASVELSAGDIASHFDVTRPAISQHLSVLKEAGLVAERRDGTKRLYSVRPQGLQELRSFLETFWSARLRRLKGIAEAHERSTRRHAIRRNRRRRPRDQDQRHT